MKRDIETAAKLINFSHKYKIPFLSKYLIKKANEILFKSIDEEITGKLKTLLCEDPSSEEFTKVYRDLPAKLKFKKSK
jgi:hypothetical protein